MTTGEVAAALATTRSRVHRAVAAGLVRPARTEGGHLRFTQRDLAALKRRLGVVPRLPELSREELLVLAALARRPLGLRSARAVARASGVSPTAAIRALDRLQRSGLVERKRRGVVSVRATNVDVWQMKVGHPRWRRLGPAVAKVVLPERAIGESKDRKVPGWLSHLFWNVDVGQLDVDKDGAFIASRILASEDAQAHAWASVTLSPEAFLEAASVRGLDHRRVALAHNLAAARY